VVLVEANRRHRRLDHLDHLDVIRLVPHTIQLGRSGRYQRVSAALAILTAGDLALGDCWSLDAIQVAAGLCEAFLPGRFEERWRRGLLVILDGAHDPMKTTSLVETIRGTHSGDTPVCVLAFKPVKDVEAILQVIAPLAAAVVATQYGTAEGVATMPAPEFAAAARPAQLPHVTVRPLLADALELALNVSGRGVPIVVAVSFHAVGEAGQPAMS
jgi:folylpolyglutamate synthase/dihydropteroate synthase